MLTRENIVKNIYAHTNMRINFTNSINFKSWKQAFNSNMNHYIDKQQLNKSANSNYKIIQNIHFNNIAVYGICKLEISHSYTALIAQRNSLPNLFTKLSIDVKIT